MVTIIISSTVVKGKIKHAINRLYKGHKSMHINFYTGQNIHRFCSFSLNYAGIFNFIHEFSDAMRSFDATVKVFPQTLTR